MSGITLAATILGGMIFGSFTTLLVWRLAMNEKGIALGRSKCVHCGTKLKAKDLVPLLSYLWLGGKCAYCGKKISAFYPLTELLSVLVTVLLVFVMWGQPQFWIIAVMTAFALVLGVYDGRFHIVDRRISWPAIVLAMVWSFARTEPVTFYLIGGLVGFAFYALQYYLSGKKWVGAGDMELGLLLGLVLGWKLAIGALFFSYITGFVYVLPLLLTRRVGLKSKLPMGSFLMLGMFVFLLWGQQIYDWYFTTFFFV